MKINITGVDVETTGFKAQEGHRITEIAMLVYEFDTDTKQYHERARLSTLVNPKRIIPDFIQNLTGITPSLVADAPTWDEVAPKVARVMQSTDIFVAHNSDFDEEFITHELSRLGFKFNPDTEVFCTMQNGRFATSLGKCPKLVELCWALNVPFIAEDAHRAIYDTEMMMLALWKGIEQGYFDLAPVIDKVTEIKAIDADLD